MTSNILGLEPKRLQTRDTKIADDIRRGVSRYLTKGLNAVCLPEFSLVNDRRADLMALLPDGRFWIIEIKSSKADFMSDNKWPAYLEFCDLFSFAVAPDFPPNLLPETEGCLIADAFEAEELRKAVQRKLSAARRKAVTLRFARTAGKRLDYREQSINEPEN